MRKGLNYQKFEQEIPALALMAMRRIRLVDMLGHAKFRLIDKVELPFCIACDTAALCQHAPAALN